MVIKTLTNTRTRVYLKLKFVDYFLKAKQDG